MLLSHWGNHSACRNRARRSLKAVNGDDNFCNFKWKFVGPALSLNHPQTIAVWRDSLVRWLLHQADNVACRLPQQQQSSTQWQWEVKQSSACDEPTVTKKQREFQIFLLINSVRFVFCCPEGGRTRGGWSHLNPSPNLDHTTKGVNEEKDKLFLSSSSPSLSTPSRLFNNNLRRSQMSCQYNTNCARLRRENESKHTQKNPQKQKQKSSKLCAGDKQQQQELILLANKQMIRKANWKRHVICLHVLIQKLFLYSR